jgi:catechol 2,3-dioxygenase-like lactoylglutathione lyase family enzyme
MVRGIKGIHHIGMGVRNLQIMKSFYQGALEFKKIFEEFPEHWNPMPEMFRNSDHKVEGGIMFDQEAEGVIIELIQMGIPHPRPIREEIRYGDIGIDKITIAVPDIDQFYREYKDKVNFCFKPKLTKIPGWGEYYFVYCRDPEGNLIEFVSGMKISTDRKFGGLRWVGVSVTDLERSVSFYQKYLGFDTIVIKPHKKFSGLVDEISEFKETKVRSCLLANSRGGGMFELFELLKPRGRSIPFFSLWGDFGYMEVALICDDIHELGKYFEQNGIAFLSKPFFVPLTHPDHTGEGWFLYIKDPDGIPVEVISIVPKK